ncbi:hypothetical protein ACVBIO_17040 [Shewanella sp. 0m-8]
MKKYKSIDVLISTFGDRIYDLKDVIKEPVEGVCYLIGHQRDGGGCITPSFLDRPDIACYFLDNKGVTKSRNHLLNMSKADICYFCDDDVKLVDGFQDVLREVHNSDASPVITLRVDDEFGRPRKKELSKTTAYRNLLSILSVGTIEISVKNRFVKNKRFCEYMGAGSSIPIGDEAVFLSEFLKDNQKISYHSKVIASHPLESSGGHPSLETIYARGVTIRKVYGVFMGIPMLIAFLFLRKKLILEPSILLGFKSFVSGFIMYKIDSLKG